MEFHWKLCWLYIHKYGIRNVDMLGIYKESLLKKTGNIISKILKLKYHLSFFCFDKML